MSRQSRSEVTRKLATLTDRVDELLERMRTYVGTEISRADDYRSLPLESFEAFIRTIYDTEDAPVLGMGFLPNPKILPGTGVCWWYNSGNIQNAPTSLRPLAVGFQPEAMDFYDVTETEWWRNAVNSDGAVASGPFVDISGTDAYVVTFSRSVRVAAELIGVVAADVTVAMLQQLCQNDLLDMPRPTSVISREGMVIATNAGALLGGAIDSSTAGPKLGTAIRGTPWLLTRAR
jgi:hypothetical protein